mgnify:FL=1
MSFFIADHLFFNHLDAKNGKLAEKRLTLSVDSL